MFVWLFVYLNIPLLWTKCDSFLRWTDRYTRTGFPIRKPSDRGIMAPPRRVSPPYTSFLGMNTQGIHYQLYSVAKNKGGYSKVPLVLFLHCIFSQQNRLHGKIIKKLSAFSPQLSVNCLKAECWKLTAPTWISPYDATTSPRWFRPLFKNYGGIIAGSSVQHPPVSGGFKRTKNIYIYKEFHPIYRCSLNCQSAILLPLRISSRKTLPYWRACLKGEIRNNIFNFFRVNYFSY